MRTKQVELLATARTEIGKGPAGRLRAAGCIPGVVYGRDIPSMPVTVEASALAHAIPESAWFSTLIKLRVKGAQKGHASPSVMIVDLQRDLAAQRIISIDFHRVSLRETVRAQVAVAVVGDSPGIKQGGILDQIMHEVEVECLPTMLPDHVVVDISNLEIGDTLRVNEIAPIEGVTMSSPADDLVLVIAPPVHLEEAAPEEAAEAVVSELEEPELVGERQREEKAD